MTDRNAKTNLVLEETSDTSVVVRGGTRVEFNAGGGIVVYSNDDVRVKPAVNDGVKPQAGAAPQVGDRMEDGTIFAGISPETNAAMYALSADAPLRMQWQQAMDYAAKHEGHGHKDWRVPTTGELNVLFQNRAQIGGFHETNSPPAGWYWSSTEIADYPNCARLQRFNDGTQLWFRKSYEGPLRLVRS